jgi:hypothetical protein
MDKTVIEVSLTKAQKIVAQLKKLVISNNTVFTNSVSAHVKHQGVPEVNSELEKKIQQEKVKLTSYIMMLEDLEQAKQSLFEGNVLSGVNNLINQIEFNKKLITIWKGLHNTDTSGWAVASDVAGVERLYNINIDKLKTLPNEQPVLYKRVHTTDETEENIKKSTKEITKLEDERDKINHVYTISLKLSSKSIEQLGV